MSISRRKFVALVGGGVVLAVGVGTTAFLSTRTPTRALAPWDAAGDYADPRLRALSYALLAPNPHNRQPWLIELNGSDGVTLWRDLERDLPITDPFGRQLTIGMGCFLELMIMAANEEGYQVEETLFPQGDDGPIAVCRFVPNKGTPDPLFAHVMDRRSHKEGFDARDIPSSAAETLSIYGQIVTSGDDRDALRRIAGGAWMTEMSTQDAYMESVDLFRIGKAEINANPDGIDLGGAFMDVLYFTGAWNREIASDMNEPNVVAAAQETNEIITTSPAFVVQKSRSNDRIGQLAAGRTWLRFNLAATGLGLATRPVSQAIQEYPEVQPYFKEIHEQFAEDGETIQMLGLLGFGELTPKTPRWGLETRLIET